MEEKLQELKQRLARGIDLAYAGNMLDWDQSVMMPPGGAQQRADQVATLSALAHQFLTDEMVGRLLEDLRLYEESLPFESDEASLIRVARRDYERRVRIPGELVEEVARTSSLAEQAWRQARKTSDFALFAPHLKKTVDLNIRMAECFAPYENRYDPLLDYYEPGLTQAIIAPIFAELRPKLSALIRAISAHKDRVNASVLHRSVSVDRQLAFNQEVTGLLGYNYDWGRLDTSAHPFTTRIAPWDVRITTRFKEDEPIDALMSSIHEAGHGIHIQNMSKALYRTGLEIGPSQAINESQARFFENMLGRSKAFWRFMYPKLQQAYAPQFNDLPLDLFYAAINRVEPGLIRVEADEVTYGMHIMLRFEIENDLINERVRVGDLPEIWNAKMQEYLGITPSNDAAGVLQDIHWTSGFGYFPDYLLGSMFSAQLWEAVKLAHPDIEDQIARGEYGAVVGWLRERVMQHGRKFTLPQMAQQATGQALTAEPYLAYLTHKFSEIYDLALNGD
jgi:carboxypeptidase Taq